MSIEAALSGSQEVRIFKNGVEMSFLNEAGELEAPPFIENDRTFIPVRKVSEALGAKVLWASDGNKQTIIIILDSIVIRLVVGERNMSIWRNVPDANLEMWRTESINISPEKVDEWNNNGLPITETKILDVTPQVLSDRTYVPIRFISEALGKKVGWDNEESTAYIWTNMEARDENDYDIVIYGGGLQAYASAVAAAKQRTTKLTKILLIAPYPVDELGGISTTGGQNAWDVSKSPNGEFYHQGTFKTLYNRFPMSYNTQEMSNYLKSSLNDYLVDYKTQYDISRVICKEKAAGNTEEPIKIEKITIRGIARDNEAADYTNGYVKWTNAAPITITGKIFIDASEEGRLARSLNTAATTGRYNWPADSLDDDEKGVISDSPTKTVPCDNTPAVRQQAATIIYKLKGVDLSGYQGSTSSETNGVYHSLWGGDKYKIKGSETWKFNDEYSNQGIIIKSLNAGTNNPANDDYYINNFLLFNVDGRANYRDTPEGRRGFSSENSEDENYIQDFYPKNIFKDTMTTDEAWVKARDFFVYHKKEILNVLHDIPGFESASFTGYSNDDGGQPEICDILYLRETVHTSKNFSQRSNNSENNYHVMIDDAFQGISGVYDEIEEGEQDEFKLTHANHVIIDKKEKEKNKNFSHRIGIASYGLDIHPYGVRDLIDEKSSDGIKYIWHDKSFQKMRPDFKDNYLDKCRNFYNPDKFYSSEYPLYVPFEALITNQVSNLLLPGYAAGVSSEAWGLVRIFANLCVLGDAAGVTAAYSVADGTDPLFLNEADIRGIQNCLENFMGARLDICGQD